MKTLLQLTHHIGPFFLPFPLFLPLLFFQLAYKWLILNLRLLYQAGGFYLDCLLAVGWRFPSLWRQHGSHSRHVTLKPLYGFHCTRGHPDFLTWVWLDFGKKKDSWMVSWTWTFFVQKQNDWDPFGALNLSTIKPVICSLFNVKHKVFMFWDLWYHLNLFWNCEIFDFLETMFFWVNFEKIK